MQLISMAARSGSRCCTASTRQSRLLLMASASASTALSLRTSCRGIWFGMSKLGLSCKVSTGGKATLPFNPLTLVVNTNTTSNLQLALRTGSASYNSPSAMTIYTASARNQIRTNSKVTPAILAVVNSLLAKFGGESTDIFLSSQAGNVTAVERALRCKGCLSSLYAAE